MNGAATSVSDTNGSADRYSSPGNPYSMSNKSWQATSCFTGLPSTTCMMQPTGHWPRWP